MDFKRDLNREDLFLNAHHIKPEVYIKYELNPDKTFKTFTLKFRYKDREWIMEEVYKGTTNLTDYCTLTGIEEPFRNPKGAMNDAEHKLIEFMKEL